MPLPQPAIDAICGATGAFGCTYVGMPFDTIKVRLQTASSSTFSGPMQCLRRSVAEEGFSALWKGSVPALTSCIIENLVVFAAQGVIHNATAAALRTTGVVEDDHGAYLGFVPEVRPVPRVRETSASSKPPSHICLPPPPVNFLSA